MAQQRDGKSRSDLYRWVKIGGLLSFLPFVLVAGPLGGYVLGKYIEQRFSLPAYVSILLITIGFVGSFKETIKIVKIALRTQEKA